MREAAFIQRNQAKWQRLEHVLQGLDGLSGDEASSLYIELNDDLSYARTFYPKSNIPTYLNGLASRLHQHIYRNQRTPRGRFLTFWRDEVPLAMAATRKQFLLAFVVFGAAMLMGALSAAHDESFVRLILGDGYVDMTLENIRKGEPMAVYGGHDESLMFLGITINNVRVALLCFAAGLFASFGTGLLLLYNGIMVGAFQYFFHQQGVLRESLLTIWVHGTLEISAIIIAGAAGFALGNGMLFPGTYTRIESFRNGARTGLKVVIGLVPVFIVAGFLESFVTRHALTIPWYVSLAIIVCSFLFIVLYFIILPYHAERRPRAVEPGP
ncbi:MAG: stage II sporulation protein M [Flavobacteriales bacterium]|nr:stage II sporulation protein M [Flavobacteriales bacterium]